MHPGIEPSQRATSTWSLATNSLPYEVQICRNFLEVCKFIFPKKIAFLLVLIEFPRTSLHRNWRLKNFNRVYCETTQCAKDCGMALITMFKNQFLWWEYGLKPVFTQLKPYFNVRTFFLIFYMWRMEFNNDTSKKIIVLIFLAMKATILDTPVSF